LASWTHLLLADDWQTLPIDNKASTANVIKKNRPLNIAYMPPATEFNYYLDIGKGIKAAAIKSNNKSVMFAPQTDNPIIQAKMITEIIRRKFDAIILSTHDPVSIAPIIKRAVDKGIVVIIVNSDNPYFPTPVHGIVGYRQYNGTKKMAQYLLQKCTVKTLNIALISGVPGYHSTQRVNGFLDVIKDSKLRVVAQENGQWNTEGGYHATLKIFKATPSINVVFAVNDYEIIGAESALQSLGKTGVILLGNDGDPAVLERINEDRITATLYTDPIGMGKVATNMVIDIINGRFNGGFVTTPTTIIDKSNLAQVWQAPVTIVGSNMKEITIVSDEREDLTNDNGSGFYWDLMRNIFEPAGVNVVTKIRPSKRAASEVKNKLSDAMLGAIRGDVDGVLYPQWYYSADYVSVIYKHAKFLNWHGQDTIANKTVSWVRGYDFDKYLYVPVEPVQVTSRIQGLKLMSTGRIDFFFDNLFDLNKAMLASADELKKYNFIANDYHIENVLEHKQYLAFANTQKGIYMRKLFDDRFAQMLFSGELKTFFNKWHYPYPFN
jgi:ribose transport system substrate-binding protein